MEKNTLQNSLNELSKGTTNNVDSIMIRDAAGNQYWIAKADLASVLGGLQNLNTYFKDRGLTNSDTFDFNNAATGVYTVNNRECQNQPINEIGVLLCFRSTYIAQFFVSLIGNKTYVRTRDNLQDSWRDWNELQLSQILSTLL